MKKNNILIELTPLLDVILIMLFFILVQSEGRMGSFYEETREALQEEFAILEAGLEEYLARHADEMYTLRGISDDYHALRLGLEEDTGVILVSIEADPRDSNNRWITIEADGNSTRIDLCWVNYYRDAAALTLNTTLGNKIQDSGNTVIIIAFRFDSGNIFVADHRLVSNAIHIQRQFSDLVTSVDIRI